MKTYLFPFKCGILAVTAILACAIGLTSCGDDEPENETKIPDPSQVSRAILIYAVNKSSLAEDFTDDSAEILDAVANHGNDDTEILVYRTDSNSECSLSRVKKVRKGEAVFEPLTTYPRNVTSTHPGRISKVINDALSLYPDAKYDLIFWGHGMSWYPYFTDHTVKADMPALYSYGGEYNSSGWTTDWTEIDDLAEAVPSGKFDLIWFDCCYMSGIEVYWEFKDKCKTLVAYPSEVWQYGMDYSRVLPELMSKDRNIVAATKEFYQVYANQSLPVTVAVADMTKITEVAKAARNIAGVGIMDYTKGLLNYSRTSSAPFYDLRQFFVTSAMMYNRPDLADDFKAAMERFIIWHGESDKDFNLRSWEKENISGVSVHFPIPYNSREEEYYRTLGWYKEVFLNDKR